MILLFIGCAEQTSEISDDMTEEKSQKVLLFVGTYTDQEGHVNGKAEGVYALTFNVSDGSLSPTNLKAQTTNPSYLVVDAVSKNIYCVNEKVGEGEQISAFSYTDDSITFINSLPANGGAPCYITKVGDYLLTANYVGGNFAMYSLGEQGEIGQLKQVIQKKGKGKTSRQEAPHAHMITQNPHTEEIFAVDLGTDEITIYDLDPQEALLKEISVIKLAAGSGPRHVDFHPSENLVYVLNELDGTIDVLSKQGNTYQSVQNVKSTAQKNNEEAGCAAIKVHPSGQYLYASNRGPFNTISQFKIQEDGQLEYIDEINSGGEVPRDFTIDPSGQYLLAANQNSNNIVVFNLDTETGQLTPSGVQMAAPTPVCLKFE